MAAVLHWRQSPTQTKKKRKKKITDEESAKHNVLNLQFADISVMCNMSGNPACGVKESLNMNIIRVQCEQRRRSTAALSTALICGQRSGQN